MDIKKLADVKDRFADYEKIFNSGDYDKAADILSAILERIEECTDERKAGTMDDTFVKKSDMDGRPIYISLNHVMEYYVYACYFEPETDVLCTELPVGEYYRTYGSLCLKLSKFRRAEDAFKKAICWNPVDLDSYLGLAECYKNLNMLSRYADNELKYLEQALNDKTPEYSVKQMQEILDKNEVEPGPDSKTIGIIYRVGELMMNDKDYRLARDCFSIVYDITQEAQLKTLLDELDKNLEADNA